MYLDINSTFKASGDACDEVGLEMVPLAPICYIGTCHFVTVRGLDIGRKNESAAEYTVSLLL